MSLWRSIIRIGIVLMIAPSPLLSFMGVARTSFILPNALNYNKCNNYHHPSLVRSFSSPSLEASSSPSDDDDAETTNTASTNSAAEEEETTIHHVVFEYCTGCRWMTRSIWMAQELLTTFNDDNLSAITLVPSRPPPGARFVVTYFGSHSSSSSSSKESTTTTTILWDRETQQGFPEVKELKQMVRDKIDPELYLGHSDSKERDPASANDNDSDSSDNSEDSMVGPASSANVLKTIREQVPKPNIAIQYCTGCRWMLRSAYFATELLTMFKDEINSLTLIPSRPPEKGGIFTVTVNGDSILWDRAAEQGFPEVKELKQIVRDMLAPSKDLGHIDKHQKKKEDDDEIDDEDAEKMRSFYGVL